MGALMVDMGVDPKGYEKIPVQQPSHHSPLIVGVDPVDVFRGNQPFPRRYGKIG
jgi:hypothetical protein